MKPLRDSISGRMAVVAVIALDCVLLKAPLAFAGAYLLALALEVGYASWRVGDARSRRFWGGFLGAGCLLLSTFLACHRYFNRAVVGWPAFLYRSYRESLSRMSPEMVDWLLTHVQVLDPNRELSVIQMVGVFEVCYGLPMILLSTVAGLFVLHAPGFRPSDPEAQALGAMPR